MTSQLSSAELRARLSRDGFVLIPQAFDVNTLKKYRVAAQGATKLARAGQWPFVRIVGKQFPPWRVEDRPQGIWGVQHLLHPDMPTEFRQPFLESYFHETIVENVQALLQCERGDLVLELYNMLVTPERDFALRWHRDDIGPDVSAEEEEVRLREPMMHAQWNLALYHDSSLVVVPGSHRRARTEMERNADPFEDDMPGQMIVRMAPGDVVFYNNNILHRGVYNSSVERMTLHGTMGLSGIDKARARNILQHGLGEWIARCAFHELRGPMAELAVAARARLLAMGSEKDLGFSQND